MKNEDQSRGVAHGKNIHLLDRQSTLGARGACATVSEVLRVSWGAFFFNDCTLLPFSLALSLFPSLFLLLPPPSSFPLPPSPRPLSSFPPSYSEKSSNWSERMHSDLASSTPYRDKYQVLIRQCPISLDLKARLNLYTVNWDCRFLFWYCWKVQFWWRFSRIGPQSYWPYHVVFLDWHREKRWDLSSSGVFIVFCLNWVHFAMFSKTSTVWTWDSDHAPCQSASSIGPEGRSQSAVRIYPL